MWIFFFLVCVCVHMYTCMHIKHRSLCQVSSLITLHLVYWNKFSNCSFWLIELVDLLQESPFLPSKYWHYSWSPISAWHWHGLWGLKLWFSHLCSKGILHWAISPAPKTCIYTFTINVWFRATHTHTHLSFMTFLMFIYFVFIYRYFYIYINMYIVLYTWHFQIYFVFLSPVTVCVCALLNSGLYLCV